MYTFTENISISYVKFTFSTIKCILIQYIHCRKHIDFIYKICFFCTSIEYIRYTKPIDFIYKVSIFVKSQFQRCYSIWKTTNFMPENTMGEFVQLFIRIFSIQITTLELAKIIERNDIAFKKSNFSRWLCKNSTNFIWKNNVACWKQKLTKSYTNLQFPFFVWNNYTFYTRYVDIAVQEGVKSR